MLLCRNKEAKSNERNRKPVVIVAIAAFLALIAFGIVFAVVWPKCKHNYVGIGGHKHRNVTLT